MYVQVCEGISISGILCAPSLWALRYRLEATWMLYEPLHSYIYDMCVCVFIERERLAQMLARDNQSIDEKEVASAIVVKDGAHLVQWSLHGTTLLITCYQC